MPSLNLFAGAVMLFALTACASSGVHNSAIMQQLYAVETDPISQWPAQQQRDISALKQDFITRYQRDYPQAEVYAAFLQLSECPLDQARALQIAGISPDMVNPPSKTEQLINNSTVTYERIRIRSTAEGCRSLENTDLHIVPNMVANIKRLPDDTDYPVYIDAAYLLDLKNQIKTNGNWQEVDYGLKRISLKRYRDASGIPDFPYAEALWQQTETLRQGDTDVSMFKEQPMYLVTYFAPSSDRYMDVTLFRQTLLNKTGNNITFRWKEGDDILTRTWTNKGTVLSQKNGKQHGIYSMPIANQPEKIYCNDEGEHVDYFRREGKYDCVAVSKSEYGQDGVLVNPNVALREQLAALQSNHPEPEPEPAPAATMAASADQPDTATDLITNTATECSKAYAARKACEKIPGDPFGMAMKLCLSTAKKKFGGLDCPIDF